MEVIFKNTTIIKREHIRCGSCENGEQKVVGCLHTTYIFADGYCEFPAGGNGKLRETWEEMAGRHFNIRTLENFALT